MPDLDGLRDAVARSRERVRDEVANARTTGAEGLATGTVTARSTGRVIASQLVSAAVAGVARLGQLVLGGRRGSFKPLIALLILLFGLSIALLIRFAAAATSVETGSGPFLQFLVGVIRSPFIFPITIVAAMLIVFAKLDRIRAKAVAARTAWSTDTIHRLALEGRTTDGTMPVYGDRGHDERQLYAKLMRGFEGQASSQRPSYAADPSTRAIEDGIAGELPAPEDHTHVDVDVFAQQALVGKRAAFDIAHRVEAVVDEEGCEAAFADANDIDPGPVDRLRGLVPTPGGDRGADTDDAWDALGDVKRRWQTLKKDLAASFSYREFITRFAFPTGLTAFAIFVAARTIWFKLWVYGLILAFSATVGLAYYTVTKWRTRRKLDSLRDQSSPQGWSDGAVLVKTVETEDVRGYYAWLAGRTYFDAEVYPEDGAAKRRIAEKVASRWHDLLQGRSITPSIQEHFADRAVKFYPYVHLVEANDELVGRPAIIDDMIDTLADATNPDQMLPRDTAFVRRASRRGPRPGHDPDLIREHFQDSYGDAWVDEPMTMESESGGQKELHLVNLRSDARPADARAIEAQLSATFDVDEEPWYELGPSPSHDQLLEQNREFTPQ